MQPLKITQRGLDWLAKTDSFKVLHQFDHVINLINRSNQILAIHTIKVGMGPFSCLIEPATFQEIRSAASIELDPNKKAFSINGHLLTTADVRIWNARPNWQTLEPTKQVEIKHQLPDDVYRRMQALHQAILVHDPTAIHKAAVSLAGRGIGLTPTGDDVLLGTIYALHVLDWGHDIVQVIGQATVGRTSSLSAAFLQAAVVGEAVEQWHDVIDKKAGALNRLLAIGATSGKDAWCGFTSGLKALTSQRKP